MNGPTIAYLESPFDNLERASVEHTKSGGRACAVDCMNDVKRLTPPYPSYMSMRTLFGSLHDNGTPSRIDRSVMKTFSNAVGTQLITGLKFLKAINEEQRPSEDFLELIDSYGGPNWKKQLLAMLEKAYPDMFGLSLEVVSPAEFSEAFRRAYGVEGDVLRKCMTFFINAMQDTDFPISKYLLAGKKPRGPGSNKKRASKPAAQKDKDAPENGNGAGERPPADRAPPVVVKPSTMLLAHLKDMSATEQEAAWVLMKYFAAKDL